MSKITKKNFQILQEQDNYFEERLTNNYYFPFELECFKSTNYFSEEEELEIKKYQSKILIIQWSVFLGIILLNLWIHLPQIGSSIQEAQTNSVKQLVNMNRPNI